MQRMRVAIAAAGIAVVFVVGAPLAASAQGGVPVGAADAGEAIAFGDADAAQTTVPPLPAGMSYTAGAGGGRHTVLLRSDGQAIGFGDDTYGQATVPALPAGMSYTAVAAGSTHTVLLRSDGQVLALGMDATLDGYLDVPPLPPGMSYTGVAAGAWHTVLLRSDGQAIAFGYDGGGRTDVPVLPPGLSYTAVAAGYHNTVLLRSDGQVFVLGTDVWGSTAVPALPSGLVYTEIAMGASHTVLLRSDGEVVAFGYDFEHQAEVPALPVGVSYTGVSAGYTHTVLLRSDGMAVAFGDDSYGQTDIPALPAGARYTAVVAGYNHTVLIRAAETPSASVTFETGPGASSVPPLQLAVGDLVPEPPAPTRVGFTFVEWRTGDASGPAWDFDVDTVPADLTLYAVWAANSYTILFLVDGAVYSAHPIDHGDQLLASGLPAAPQKPGYTFDGWWDGATRFVLPHTAAGNLTLEAHWKAAASLTVDPPQRGLPVTGVTGLQPAAALGALLLACGAVLLAVRRQAR